ncbi:MAG: phage tail tape measure protein, partial [Planktothrix sp.]
KVVGGLKGIQKETGGLAKSASKMGDVFKTAFGNIIANLATGALSAFTGALKGSLDAFLGYEKGLVQFQAISGATKDDVASLSNEVKRLGSVTPKSAGEISAMTVSLARAGLTAEQAEQALNGIVQGSIASGESLENFGSILATTANVFGFFEPGMIDFLGEEITDTGAKFDKATALMVAGANSSNQSVADLGAAMKNMGGAVTVANKGLEDGIFLTQVLAQTGVVGAEAGTVGKSLLGTLTQANGLLTGSIAEGSAQAEKAATVFKKYGISISDNNGELLDSPELMARVSTAFQSIEDPAERAAFATEAFGQEFGAKLGSAMGLPLAELERLNAGLLNNELAFQQTSDVMQEGLGGAIARMQSALEGLQIQLAGAIAPALTLATDLFTGFMNAMGEAAGQVQGLDLLTGIY